MVCEYCIRQRRSFKKTLYYSFMRDQPKPAFTSRERWETRCWYLLMCTGSPTVPTPWTAVMQAADAQCLSCLVTWKHLEFKILLGKMIAHVLVHMSLINICFEQIFNPSYLPTWWKLWRIYRTASFHVSSSHRIRIPFVSEEWLIVQSNLDTNSFPTTKLDTNASVYPGTQWQVKLWIRE